MPGFVDELRESAIAAAFTGWVRSRTTGLFTHSLDEARALAVGGSFVTLRSGTMHALVKGSGPDVLLVHGVTENLHTFTGVQGALAGEARTHALDLLGHGLSDIPHTALSMTDMARQVLEYMDAASVARATVVGWSMGGGVALCLASIAPERVRSLVLIGSLGLRFPAPQNLGLLALPAVGEAMSAVTHSPALQLQLLRENFHPDHPPSPEMAARYWEAWRVQGRAAYVRALLRDLDVMEPERALAGIRAAVEVVHGADDRIIPVSVGRALAARLSRSNLRILPRTGHSAHLERPEETLDAIRAALAAPA